MSADIQIQVLHTIEEFKAVLQIEEIVWGLNKRDTPSPYVMNVVAHNGGLILGARHGSTWVGFAYALAGRRGDTPRLWSHIAAVLPAYQGRGIGRQMKLAQRDWALKNGYSLISWTFDPLQRRNAVFNMCYMGAVGDIYHVNHYGPMEDQLNLGMESDRFEASWYLNHPHTLDRIADPRPNCAPGEGVPALLHRERDGTPALTLPYTFDAPAYAVEIPWDVNALKRANLPLAKHWLSDVRTAMQTALAAGYSAVDVYLQDHRCWYVLRPFG